jgi:hypothetical protein
VVAKYRKLPVVIEAVQYTGRNALTEIEPLFNESRREWVVKESPVLDACGMDLCKAYGAYLQIKTLEGVMIAIPGDYIIKGVKGEVYPCKPDVFEATYEKICE